MNGVEYKNGAVDRFAHTEGAVVRQADGTTFLHEYSIKDHLGNTRVTYSDANNDGFIAVSDIKQINHYYAFGMNMEGNWNGAGGSNKYQYNGKEWNDDFGLGWNDYGARFYDPAIARWGAVDPMAGIYTALSPYNYTKNNPIKFIDPNGMAVEEMADRTRYTGQDAVNAYNSVKSRYPNSPPGIYLNLVGDIIWDTSEKGNKNPNVYLFENGKSKFLGQIGGVIIIDEIYANLIEQNIAIAQGLYNPFTFKAMVTDGGEWDYKARYNQSRRRNTIYGLVNTLRNTTFSFNGQIMRAEDLGNHHFGVVALAVRIPWHEEFILRECGANQMSKPGLSKPEWQKYRVVYTPQGNLQGTMLPPYGDDPIDQYWIQQGFEYFKKLKP